MFQRPQISRGHTMIGWAASDGFVVPPPSFLVVWCRPPKPPARLFRRVVRRAVQPLVVVFDLEQTSEPGSVKHLSTVRTHGLPWYSLCSQQNCESEFYPPKFVSLVLFIYCVADLFDFIFTRFSLGLPPPSPSHGLPFFIPLSTLFNCPFSGWPGLCPR